MLKNNKMKIRNRISHMFNFKVELVCISILTVTLIFLGWAYIYQETRKYKENVTENFISNQEILVDQVAKSVKESLETQSSAGIYPAEQAEEMVIANIIKKAETSGSRYWFFYTEDRVIFEKNIETTKKLQKINVQDLELYWKLQGGSGMAAYIKMLTEEQNGSVVFSKDYNIGNEIVSQEFFKVKDRNYFLGMSTIQSYVMTAARVNEHILYLWTFSALVSLDILIFSLLLCLKIYRSQKEAENLNKSLTDKNMQIQELSHNLQIKGEAFQSATIYDSLTKLYNRKFFDNLVSKINHELLLPVSIVVLDINGLGQLNSMADYSVGDVLLEKTAEILHKVCIDTDIVARTGSSEFTILMTSTKETEAYGTARNIKRQFSNLENSELTLSIGVAQMRIKENNIIEVLEAARKNLILEKMLEKNSSSSSIIAMMMVTLSAYSQETVEHSNRMRTMAILFGKHLGMLPSELSRLAVAAQLHDVGKIGIPDSILNKKEVLDGHEKDLIRRHSELGYNIVKAIPFLDEVAVDILHHHESYNGTGYPYGLKGEEISLHGRIINIIDSFDAMTNRSVYSATKTAEEAIHELLRKSNQQFDPHLINEFVKGITNHFQDTEN